MIQLSESVRACQTPETLAALGYTAPAPDRQPAPKPAPASPGKMTKTEARFLAEVLKPREAVGEITAVVFHPVNFHLRNGHRYTPDFAYLSGGRAHFVEVKGSYRLRSYRSAVLAFDQARLEWPCFVWIWAELRSNGPWEIKHA